LDTNIIIALFAENPVVHEQIANASEVFVPCIAIGELYFGAYKSLKASDNIARIDEFALTSAVLSCDTGTAKRYGEIKNLLKKRGQPIPENDIWVAAIARQYDLVLITEDAHFDMIEDLQVVGIGS